MRLTAFIMNLLVIMMILAPCRDHRDVSLSKATTPQLYAAAQQDGQADDDCSPLCTCSCCAAVSLSYHTLMVQAATPGSSVKKIPFYITPDHTTGLSSIWQPPRIG